jgi:Tfp pilus assembly protein PilN
MKAVNLMPQEGRAGRTRGAGSAASGTGVYVVLALLAIAVVVTALSALAGRDLSAKEAELAGAESAAQVVEAKAAALGAADQTAAPGKARMETIEGLIDGRFDWSRSLREVARAVPADVDLTSLVGTVAPGTAVAGGGGGSLRAALPVPAIDLIGCAPSHSRVATVVSRLRAISGVQRVSLASSEKSDAGSLSTTDCRANDKSPQFQLTVFYEAPKGLVPAVDAAVPAAGGAAPPAAPAAPAGGAQ